jgi:hypothetical protein
MVMQCQVKCASQRHWKLQKKLESRVSVQAVVGYRNF